MEARGAHPNTLRSPCGNPADSSPRYSPMWRAISPFEPSVGQDVDEAKELRFQLVPAAWTTPAAGRSTLAPRKDARSRPGHPREDLPANPLDLRLQAIHRPLEGSRRGSPCQILIGHPLPARAPLDPAARRTGLAPPAERSRILACFPPDAIRRALSKKASQPRIQSLPASLQTKNR